jgi:hypothetical protein
MQKTTKIIAIDNFAFVPTFQTTDSLSFAVVRNSVDLNLANQKGWVDLHEIKSPKRSLTIRGSLPSECLRFDFLNRLIDELFSCLHLSMNISRDVLFFKATECIDMSRCGGEDEDDQTTDRISTTRSFELPGT